MVAPAGFVHVPEEVKVWICGETSVIIFAVGPANTSQPTATDRAVVDSCARVIVNVSVATTVTRAISAVVEYASGEVPAGTITMLNGAAGNLAP